jgi:hypothetical protein
MVTGDPYGEFDLRPREGLSVGSAHRCNETEQPALQSTVC